MMSEASMQINGNDAVIEHQRLNTLINSMADAVIAVDEFAKIVEFNAAALNILDINNLSLNTPLNEVFKPVDKDNRPVDIIDLVLSTKVPTTNRDLLLTYQDNSRINLYISIAPVRLSYGSNGQSGYVLLVRDITREKSLEEERDEFISVASHELRTPIAITEGNISNAMFMANKMNASDQIKQALKSAHDQVIFLSEMINDLSTLSRAERNSLQIEAGEINVQELIDSLNNSYKDQAKLKNLQFICKADPDVSSLYSSQLYVKEILQNFITNAIKYTEHGSVTLQAKSIDNGVIFSVEDTGIGISKADQEKVFDKFFRSEDYRTRKSNGTGLGLYVTIKLAKLIHAQVKLDSELNQGSRFTIEVPNLTKPTS